MVELCSVCDKPADPKKYVGTGGGCDYPVCSDEHNKAVWDFLDAAEEAANNGTPEPTCPIIRWPEWI